MCVCVCVCETSTRQMFFSSEMGDYSTIAGRNCQSAIVGVFWIGGCDKEGGAEWSVAKQMWCRLTMILGWW